MRSAREVMHVGRSLRACLLSTVALYAAQMLAPSAATASFWTDLGGVITDPLKLQSSSKEVSASLQRTMFQLDQLESQSNYDIADRINQVSQVVNEALSGSEALEAKAISDANNLEQQVNSDAINLIYNIQCTTDVILNGQLQQSFASLLNKFGDAQLSLHIFGIKVADLQSKKVSVQNPDQAYWSVKSQIMAALEAKTTDNSLAYEITSTYDDLALTAEQTACFYRHQPDKESEFISEINNLKIMSLEWKSVVLPIHP